MGFGSLGLDPLLAHSKLLPLAGIVLDLPKGKEGEHQIHRLKSQVLASIKLNLIIDLSMHSIQLCRE